MFPKWKHGVPCTKCRACDVATQLEFHQAHFAQKAGFDRAKIALFPDRHS
jgi:hypothetical protein